LESNAAEGRKAVIRYANSSGIVGADDGEDEDISN
jgi:hypothetical protein